MSGDILSIGIRGLLAFQNAIGVTSNNIENAGTAFYSRRQVDLVEALSNDGVDLADVRRIYDGFASENLRNANSQYGQGDMYFEQLTQISSFLGDDKNNLGTYLLNSLTSLRELNSQAGSATNRSLYKQQLDILCGRFNAIGQQLDQQQVNINSSLITLTGTVSKIATNLAQINQQITNAQGANNDALLDQREAQLQELAKYVDISTSIDTNGIMTVMLNNGTPLVLGTQSFALSTTANTSNPNTLSIVVAAGSGNLDVTDVIHGGQIAGLYKTQTTLQQTLNSLGRVAIGIMSEFNAQNKLGIDQNYNLGGDIFLDVNDPSLVTQRAINYASNTGNANITVDINAVNQLTTSDYKLVFDTPTHFNLTRLSDNSIVSSGALGALPQQIAVDGMSINLNSGTINAGDSFTISPTRGMAQDIHVAITDPSLIALGWPVDVSTTSVSGHIAVSDITDITNSSFATAHQLSPPIKVVFTSTTTYDLIDANTNLPIETGISYDPTQVNDVFPTPGSYDPGYRVQLSGNIANGDTFNIFYTQNNTSDIRNGKKFEDLYSKGVFEGDKNVTFNGAYNLFSANLAVETNSSKTSWQGDKIVLEKATTNYAQVSGVSIPEETTNLNRYQEAYQASAQIIEVAKTIFDTIVGLGRR